VSRRRGAALLLAALLALAGCTVPGGGGSPTPSAPGGASGPPALSPFCRRLLALDDLVRRVRSLTDETASVERYAAWVPRLDVAERRAEALAPEGVDLSAIRWANGRFGEIVRGLPPDLDPASARSAVVLTLEAYATGLYQTLVRACGPESVEP
jgi:hypothetical protein